MKNTYLPISLLLLCCTVNMHGQLPKFYKYTTPSVTINGSPLKNAWAGGLNAPVFNTIDMNGDGRKDLFLFDHQFNTSYPSAFKIRTFINNGISGQADYTYAPQYEQKFPQDMHDWVLLVDYDCDGKEDIFTYTYAGGMQVYHNDYTTGGGLSFSPAYSLIYSMYLGSTYANLYVSSQNQPALIDVNGDGDLDVLTFTILGGAVEYHENMAQELFNRCDTLVMHQKRQCWGAFSLSNFTNSAILNNCHYLTSNLGDEEKTQLHNGSCMLGYDEAGDGDIDLLNGDVLGDSLLYLDNSPNINSPLYWQDSITSQDIGFPSYDTTVSFVKFTAPYIFDADNDGIKDLVVTPCSEDKTEDFVNNWFFKNTGNNVNHVFHYTKKRFLTDEMIDVGSGANVTFFDADADGKKDLIIGNYGYFVSNAPIHHYESALAFYKNTSAGGVLSFAEISVDYASLRQYNLLNIQPTFGDIDNDGDDDMILGNYDGNLYLFNNTAGSGNPAVFTLAPNGINYQSIDVGAFSAPQLVDVNNDGLLDLIIGEMFGKVWYYQNTGSLTIPVFTLASNNFGGVNVCNQQYNPNIGFSVPHMYLDNGSHKLMVGNENGYLFVYDNIDGNLSGTFNIVSTSAFDVYEPYRLSADMDDLNADGCMDIITGCFAGGLSYYSTCATGIFENNENNFEFTVYPNPAYDRFVVEFKKRNAKNRSLQLFDMPGKLIKQINSAQLKESVDVNNLGAGIYFIKITEDDRTITQKLIVK